MGGFMEKVEARIDLKTDKDLLDVWFDLIHALQRVGFGIDKAEIRRKRCQEKEEIQNME